MSIVQSVPWLESVDAKLDRAKEHLDLINRNVDQFIKDAKHHFIPKVYPSTNEAAIIWWMDEPSHPPLRVSVEIGEFLYNLRSALDNLVCALVRCAKNSYGVSCSDNEFPITNDPDKFATRASWALKGVPSAPRTLIEELQPYARGLRAAELDPLNILNVLRNRDTHRALHLGLAYNKNTQFIIRDSSTRRVIAYAVLPHVVYPVHDPQTIPLPITAAEMPAAVDVARNTTGGVSFREEGPWGERSVTEVLITCFEHVERRVIARFKPFFGPSSE